MSLSIYTMFMLSAFVAAGLALGLLLAPRMMLWIGVLIVGLVVDLAILLSMARA